MIYCSENCIFQSTPLIRGETERAAKSGTVAKFQSTPLIRGETHTSMTRSQSRKFQSTPLIRGETQATINVRVSRSISIHSPHTRGDSCGYSCRSRSWHFNPLPSYEGRPSASASRVRITTFQSTPLIRGETWLCDASAWTCAFQSTPLIRGETAVSFHHRVYCSDISIHSPHTRGDGV